MPVATEERIQHSLVDEGICATESANRVASVVAGEINEVERTKVGIDAFELRIAELNTSIARLARDFAERDAERAREMRHFVSEMQELERQRDERERRRDERERQWDRDSQAFQRRMQAWGYALFGLWLGSVGVLASVMAFVL